MPDFTLAAATCGLVLGNQTLGDACPLAKAFLGWPRRSKQTGVGRVDRGHPLQGDIRRHKGLRLQKRRAGCIGGIGHAFDDSLSPSFVELVDCNTAMATQSQRASRRSRARSSSAVLWVLFALWILVIVYGSLWPWQAWRDIGTAPWSFLGDPLPRYWTWFDLLSNVALYLPLGLLLALNRAPPRRAGLGLALLVGALLSLTIEAAQSYLPQRVPSLLDLAANTLGALIGGLLAAGLRRPWHSLRRLSSSWWHRDGQWPAVLVILWLSIRLSSLLGPNQAGLWLTGPGPLGTESMIKGPAYGASASWLLVESLLVSLLLAQVCRIASVFWLGLVLSQSVLILAFLKAMAPGQIMLASWPLIWPILFWSLLLGCWALLHRRYAFGQAAWLGLGLASLWPLRSLLLLVFSSLFILAEQSSLGPGLGPSPNAGFRLGNWLLNLHQQWSESIAQWRSGLAPSWQALLDRWFGLGQPTSPAFGITPLLGRNLQHFEAVVLLVQELWRWMCLLWFLVVVLRPKRAMVRPRRL
ncbi:MAG: hypothetical protein EBX54_03135 [Betaproteobacteria bacterium]|nr:hypothetical protein [Betaproteobacteria bacterium]